MGITRWGPLAGRVTARPIRSMTVRWRGLEGDFEGKGSDGNETRWNAFRGVRVDRVGEVCFKAAGKGADSAGNDRVVVG